MPNRDKNDKQDEKEQTTIARHCQTGIESCPQHQLRSLAICLPSRRNADYFCNLQTFILCVALSGMCFFFRQQRYKHKVGGEREEKKISSAFFSIEPKIVDAL